MTRDEIYDHLAKVYLGKREKIEQKKKQPFNAWLVINIIITAVIFSSVFYGFSAFLVRRPDFTRNKIIFSLTNSTIRVPYNLNSPYPQVKAFALAVPKMDVSKYQKLNFSLRGLEEGFPGVVKVVVRNAKNETAFFYVKDIRLDWKDLSIPLQEFSQISDWTNLEQVSFVVEAWNAERKKGIILIDNICFSS